MSDSNIQNEQNIQDNKIADQQAEVPNTTDKPKEIGGPKGLEPTRYGDWLINGRVSDF